MELQIALDRIPLAHALDVTRSVAPLADWIEVGTSLVKRYGVDGLAQVVDAAGGTPVLADLKTADDAAYEFALAYDAGAASATVLGLAADATLDQASGLRPVDLLGPWADGRRLALAGGLSATDLPALADLPDVRAIVGSAVTLADDPLAAVRELRTAVRLEKEHA